MTSVAVSISEDIQMATLIQFLKDTKVVIEAQARDIHYGI